MIDASLAQAIAQDVMAAPQKRRLFKQEVQRS